MGKNIQAPTFLCDAMLGGLTRWLRAAGYDADFEYGIEDDELLSRAKRTGRIILSSDGPLFDRNIIQGDPKKFGKAGKKIPALYGPQQLTKLQQLEFVVRTLGLSLGEPRCMACGGELAEVPKHEVMAEAPPLAFCARIRRQPPGRPAAGCLDRLFAGAERRQYHAPVCPPVPPGRAAAHPGSGRLPDLPSGPV